MFKTFWSEGTQLIERSSVTEVDKLRNQIRPVTLEWYQVNCILFLCQKMRWKVKKEPPDRKIALTTYLCDRWALWWKQFAHRTQVGSVAHSLWVNDRILEDLPRRSSNHFSTYRQLNVSSPGLNTWPQNCEGALCSANCLKKVSGRLQLHKKESNTDASSRFANFSSRATSGCVDGGKQMGANEAKCLFNQFLKSPCGEHCKTIVTSKRISEAAGQWLKIIDCFYITETYFCWWRCDSRLSWWWRLHYFTTSKLKWIRSRKTRQATRLWQRTYITSRPSNTFIPDGQFGLVKYYNSSQYI